MKLTESEFDKLLFEKAQNEEFEVPESFHVRYCNLVQSLMKDPTYPKPKKRKVVPAMLAVAGAIAASSATATASVNRLQERMDKMTDSEKEEKVSDLEAAVEVSWDSFSRELSKEEKSRFWELYDMYRQGMLFPDGALAEVSKAEEAAAEGITFVTKSRVFLLPADALEDEEILQIIDFAYKRDYSLNEILSSREEFVWEPGPVTGEEAIRIAKKLLESITDVKANECEIKTDNVDEGIWVIFQKGEFECHIQVKGNTGQIISFDLIEPGTQGTDILVDEILYRKKYQEIYRLLVSQIGIVDPVESAFCSYGEKKDGTLYGNINYLFEVNQQYYVFKYHISNDQILEMGIWDMEAYNNLHIYNTEILQNKFGVESKRIDFIPSKTKENQEETK